MAEHQFDAPLLLPPSLTSTSIQPYYIAAVRYLDFIHKFGSYYTHYSLLKIGLENSPAVSVVSFLSPLHFISTVFYSS